MLDALLHHTEPRSPALVIVGDLRDLGHDLGLPFLGGRANYGTLRLTYLVTTRGCPLERG